MSWLKYTPVFKHGYGQDGWVEVRRIEDLDNVKSDAWTEHGDPEGIREPKWEVHDFPPLAVLQGNISSARRRIEEDELLIRQLREQLRELESRG